MKKIIYFLALIIVTAMSGCSSDDEKNSILISSEATDCKDNPALMLNTISGELVYDEYFKYEATTDGGLLIQHINTQHGCDSKIATTAFIKDNVITITENGNQDANCVCCYDVSMKIGKLKDRQYKIVVYKNSKEYTTLTIDYSSTLKGEYHITD